MGDKKLSPRQGIGYRLLGLDFGKYLLSSENRRTEMESDNATATESELSDWEYGAQYYAQQFENSEESDDAGLYNSDSSMFDTVIDSGDSHRLDTRQYISPTDSHSNHPAVRGTVITQLNNSHNDSAYGGSGLLYPIHETGSAVSDSSGEEDNLDGTLSDSGSPVHNPVYGRYQKIPTSGIAGDQSNEDWDTLMLHRLPGENLGMILGIEGGKDGSGKVTSVTVKSVTLGGAAYRASGSNKGLCVGDEIIQVNNTDLRTLSHDECISVFKDMPLRVLLCVKRGQKNLPAVSVSHLPPNRPNPSSHKMDVNIPVNVTKRRDFSDSEDEGSTGFALFNVTVVKDPEENLGLSIVPSYGSTKEYYQIKRILPSGAAAHSGLLHVGDRLVTCNGTSLHALTQNHCLSIIKSASSSGDVNFEVIRPVYDGSSMEISVTLNNSGSRLPSFDPQQFSLKSQSYDRQVDVIVTSESDDYLTVSEDEYSRKRLADIPEVEANEVFATNNVKLAFQKPFNTIEEEVTETEDEHGPFKKVNEKEDTDIVDLNRNDTSPYHIPKKPSTSLASDLSVKILTSNIDDISSSSTKYSKDSVAVTDIETSSFTSVSTLSPRSPIPKTDLDTVSVSSSYSKRQQVPQEDSDRSISPPYNYPQTSRSDDISVRDDTVKYNPLYEDSNISDFTDTEQGSNIDTITQIYSKKTHAIPRSDLDNISVASNRSVPYTEIDRVSVHSDSSKRARYSYSDNSRDDTLPPPPPEFSDHINDNTSDEEHDNRDIYLPYTNIDDLANESESTVDISPTHEIEIVGSGHKPRHHRVNLESSFSELERGSEDKQQDIPAIEDRDSAELAFNAELTAPFDSVLQDPSLCVQPSYDIVEYTDTVDNDILQVVQSYEDGTLVISQFDPQDNRETTDSPNYYTQDSQFSDSTMDTNSEAMLKDALDMEYDKLPESNKLENRVNLGDQFVSQESDFDDPNYKNENIVAENIALEIVKHENGGVGYYVESDDEPDQYPDQDAPGDAPDLPDEPPPMLPGTGQFMDMFAAAESTAVEFTHAPSTDISPSSTQNSVKQDSDRVPVDSNWSFKPKVLNGNKNSVGDKEIDDEIVIVPVKKEKKVEIPPKLLQEDTNPQDDVIVPVKTEKQHQLPSHFAPVEHMVTKIAVGDSDDDEFTKPKPSPRNVVNVSVGGQPDSDENEIEEDVITPTDSKKDLKRNIVNVISVVNALKAASKDTDPDIVDKIVKEDVREKLKNKVSTVIGVSADKLAEMSPPKQEQVVTRKEEVKVSVRQKPEPQQNVQVESVISKDVRKSTEVSPPVQTVIEETKESIKKPASKTVLNISGKAPSVASDFDMDPLTSDNRDKAVHISNIEVKEKEKVHEPANTYAEVMGTEPTPKPRVPPPTLPKPSKEKKETVSTSVTENKSIDQSVPSYKTTIGVTGVDTDKVSESVNKPSNENKPNIVSKTDYTSKIQVNNKTNMESKSEQTIKPDNTSKIQVSKPETVIKTNTIEKRSLQPTPQIKPLSHIKPLSFNPKSLSQSKPVQYKTTISALGSKPSGISTLGRSSLISSQKSDLPIKRMETLPFEVSILKGILGIGIKTVMTPEGYVQVSEILPNGPIGREGNIKVGDYLLSINNTPLTGLPDSKVQQILRLLPRGLSKIVASAIPPDTNSTEGLSCEKVQASESSPQLASSHVSKPATLSMSSTLTKKGCTPPQVSPRSPKSISPVASPRQLEPKVSPRQGSIQESTPVPKPTASPRSPVSPSVTTKPLESTLAPKQPEATHVPSEAAAPISPRSYQNKSPIASPRQLESKIILGQTETQIPINSSKPLPVPIARPQEHEKTSQSISPRSPPAIAPKPRRTKQTENEPSIVENVDFVPAKTIDSDAPIETEIFASINGSKSEHTPSSQSGPNILPGSMNYDSLQVADKTGWTAGVVSSADINTKDLSVDISGKTDVVNGTSSHNDDTLTISAPPIDTNIMSTEQNKQSDKHFEHSDIKSEVIKETFEELSQVEAISAPETSVLTNRPRTFSASSDASSSYTEFTECNVEDDLIPEQIVEEEESKEDADDEYEPDFDEEEVAENEEPVNTEEGNKALRTLAENIVSNVIESVKEMNLDVVKTDNDDNDSTSPTLPELAPQQIYDDVPEVSSPHQPDDIEACNIDDISITECDAPPVPTSPPPLPPVEPLPGVPAPVVDLTLYPDEIDTEAKEDTVETENLKPIYTSQVHASSRNVDVVNPETVQIANDNSNNDLMFEQVIKDTKEVAEDNDIPNDSQVVPSGKSGDYTKDGDKNISDVISMYAGIDNAMENNVNVDVKSKSDGQEIDEDSRIKEDVKVQISSNKPSVSEEIESCDTKSLTSSEDHVSDLDVIDTAPLEAEAPAGPIIETNQDKDKLNGDSKDSVADKINGHMKLPTEIAAIKDIPDDSSGSLSPRSDTKPSPRSPRSVDAFLSELESPREKYSPELNRMIRMMSASEEPKHTGEGDIIHLQMNRGVTGLGFVIQGGKGSPKGDLPITVKKVFKGGPADGLLQADDEILEVDGEDMTNMRQLEARTHLKFLPTGDVNVTLRRFKKVEEEAESNA